MRLAPILFVLLSATVGAAERTYILGVCESDSRCQMCIDIQKVIFRPGGDGKSIDIYISENGSKDSSLLKKLINCDIQSASEWICTDGRARVSSTAGRVAMEYLGSPIVRGERKYVGCLSD